MESLSWSVWLHPDIKKWVRACDGYKSMVEEPAPGLSRTKVRKPLANCKRVCISQTDTVQQTG